MKVPRIENVGWTLGNDCPYRCPHCYSAIVRNRGRNLEIADVDRIIGQLCSIDVKTINLGGNEPIFTNGPDPRKTLLPYIIRSLHEAGIVVGLTTAGITLTALERLYPESVSLLNDVDVSFDSPFPEEHDLNRGAPLFAHAMRAIGILRRRGIDRTIIMCGMKWNLSDGHIDALIELARSQEALIRINFMKPTELRHVALVPDAETFWHALERLLTQCKVIDLSEPTGSAVFGGVAAGCPCGITSFRIHSITPDGRVPVSPCVYLHDYKVGDLLQDDLADIVASPQFEAFRKRHQDPASIDGCSECRYLQECRGGCASRAYLWAKFGAEGVSRPINSIRDPYCPLAFGKSSRSKPLVMARQDAALVHRNYLCTLIVDPS
jgi:radical SAM protein with 4Fe4S-binding SPASM domain